MKALARWLSWLEHPSIHQKVVASIPSQGTYLGFRFTLVSDQCFSFTSMFLPFLFLYLPLSQKSVNMSSGEDFKRSFKE